MSRFVLDNSVCMRWLFADGDVEYASRVLRQMESGSVALVPSIWPLEAGNMICRAEARNLLTGDRSNRFLDLLRDLAIEIDPMTPTAALTQTLSLARMFSLSTYDAAYLELSIRAQLPLATLDEALREAAGRCEVKLV